MDTLSLGSGVTPLYVSMGYYHACILTTESQIKCWGREGTGLGMLGYESTTQRGDGSGEMGDNLPFVDVGSGVTVYKLQSAIYSNCVILDDFSVKCWGYNIYGQLGLGNTEALGDESGEMGDDLPTVDLGTGRTAVEIWGSLISFIFLFDLFFLGSHICVLLDNDDVKCWGRNDVGQLGQGDTVQLGDGSGEMGDDLPAVDLGSGFIVDETCKDLSPTSSPTHHPTLTYSPSYDPTMNPTSHPTMNPTMNPSSSPSFFNLVCQYYTTSSGYHHN